MSAEALIQLENGFILPASSVVEAWTSRAPRNDNLSDGEKAFIDRLKPEIRSIQSRALRCSYAYKRGWAAIPARERQDLENTLLYNPRVGVFSSFVDRIELRRSNWRDPPCARDDLLHYLKYESVDDIASDVASRSGVLTAMIECPVALFRTPSGTKRTAAFWSLFRLAQWSTTGTNSTSKESIGVSIQIEAPPALKINLADKVKVIVDAFLTAAHHEPQPCGDADLCAVAAMLDCSKSHADRVVRGDSVPTGWLRQKSLFAGRRIRFHPDDDLIDAIDIARTNNSATIDWVKITASVLK